MVNGTKSGRVGDELIVVDLTGTGKDLMVLALLTDRL